MSDGWPWEKFSTHAGIRTRNSKLKTSFWRTGPPEVVSEEPMV